MLNDFLSVCTWQTVYYIWLPNLPDEMVKMTTLTMRLPDDTHVRLRQLAKQRKMSLNKLIEELSTVALTQFEAETRFRARASQGSVATGLQLLEKLDALTGEELEQR